MNFRGDRKTNPARDVPNNPDRIVTQKKHARVRTHTLRFHGIELWPLVGGGCWREFPESFIAHVCASRTAVKPTELFVNTGTYNPVGSSSCNCILLHLDVPRGKYCLIQQVDEFLVIEYITYRISKEKYC